MIEADLPNPLLLSFNTDGLPVHKSTKYEFWPILAKVHKFNMMPIIAAIYQGQSKPPVNDFLADFAEEMLLLIENGIIINGIHFVIGIWNFICDSPARAHLKGNNFKILFY